jgi:dihydroxy-acid dehydratase
MLKRHSAAITEGADRAPARAMFKAIGFTDDDLRKPIIGVANTWTEIGPCNYHLRELAESVKAGIREGGGTPMEFNTVSISDGITMGSQGMKASLVSREVIADSIELVARGNLFDGLVAISGFRGRSWRCAGWIFPDSCCTADRLRLGSSRTMMFPFKMFLRPWVRTPVGA